jgi:hypothetical protein
MRRLLGCQCGCLLILLVLLGGLLSSKVLFPVFFFLGLVGSEVLSVVDVENGRNDGSEDSLVLRVDIECVIFLPTIVAVPADAVYKADKILIDET